MTKSLEVILSPALKDTFETEGKIIVVIDIFRATSTIASALEFGAQRVLPVLQSEETKKLSKEGYFIAGERNGQKLDGFDFGNSPRLIRDDSIKNNSLALTTTNGTKCFEWAQSTQADQVLSGSFLNISSTAQYLKGQNKSIILLCAGWKDRVNLEDTLFAGALCRLLSNQFQMIGDGSLISMGIEKCAKEVGYLEYLKNSSHYQRLNKFGAGEDMRYCLQHDLFHFPVILSDNHLIASVEVQHN